MRNITDKSCRQNQNTFYIQKTFSENRGLWDNSEKYFTAGQTTDDNRAHAHCMP